MKPKFRMGQKPDSFFKLYNSCVVKMFIFFSKSKIDILNVAIFKYSLHKFRENVLHWICPFMHDVQLLDTVASKLTIDDDREYQ